MHHTVTARTPGSRHRRNQRGAVAIMVAVCVLALTVAGAMVLDFGLVRVDRQVDKSSADAAVMGGLYGMIGGDSKPHPYAGICSAISYLNKNSDRFSAITPSAGNWKNGAGASLSFDCSSGAALYAQPCTAGDVSSWAQYLWTGDYQGTALQVDIRAGYNLNPATSGFSEDSLPAASADRVDEAQGCDQLAVIIKQNRKPGLGSLARTADLVSTIRSVGRLYSGPGSDAPAMLLLRRAGCTALEVGSTSTDNSTVRVFGARAASGRTQPGTIHADTTGRSSTGVPCTAPFYGKATNGIIAYAAPLATDSTQPDPTKPGQITSVAGLSGLPGIDSSDNVWASKGLSGTAGPKAPVSSRGLVTRKPVDDRYLGGVKTAMGGADALFTSMTSLNASSYGYTPVTCSSGNVTLTAAQAAANKLFVNCGTTKSFSTIPSATDIFFSGTVDPAGSLSLPNAAHVYILGGTPALRLSTGSDAFAMNTSSGHLNAAGNCADDFSATRAKAVLFVRSGPITMQNGLLRLCNTTVYMMGGQSDGCTPAPYSDVSTTPEPGRWCAGNSAGNGLVGTNGGSVDWTAPNKYDAMTDGNGNPIAAQAGEWSDPNGQEDLALWDETYGAGSDYKFVGGGGTFHIQGVFMVPNGEIQLSGNSTFALKNAQFVSSSLALASANTKLEMTVDPNAAVNIPRLRLVGLVR